MVQKGRLEGPFFFDLLRASWMTIWEKDRMAMHVPATCEVQPPHVYLFWRWSFFSVHICTFQPAPVTSIHDWPQWDSSTCVNMSYLSEDRKCWGLHVIDLFHLSVKKIIHGVSGGSSTLKSLSSNILAHAECGDNNYRVKSAKLSWGLGLI